MARHDSRGCGCGTVWGLFVWAMIILVVFVGLSFTEALDVIEQGITVLWFVFLVAVAVGILFLVARLLSRTFGWFGDLNWSRGHRQYTPPTGPTKPRRLGRKPPEPMPPGTYMDRTGAVRCSRCYGRRAFRTEREARKAAEHAVLAGERFSVYFEEQCRLWHLGPQ